MGTAAKANGLNSGMTLSELEYEIADHPRRVNERARQSFATCYPWQLQSEEKDGKALEAAS